MSQTIGGIIAPVVGNLADTYSLPAAMMTLVPFLVVGLGASLILKDPKITIKNKQKEPFT